MTTRPIAKQLGYSLAGFLVLVTASPARVLAQHDQTHATASQSHESQERRNQASAFIRLVRESTERFHDVAQAEAEGYALQFGCVSGSDYGAMGLHYVNGPLVGDGDLDPTHPEIVIYEQTPGGRLRMTGADYLVIADAWHAKHGPAPPELGGQLLHLFETPNRFGLPAFYTLHVWAWKDNPNGAFVNWHPNVSCNSFAQLP